MRPWRNGRALVRATIRHASPKGFMSAASTARRKKNERANKRDRKRRGAASGKQPAKDAAYLDFIRSLPCCVPTCTSKNLHKWADVSGSTTEAAHVGDRGLRQKCSDYEVLPLCVFHHRTGPEAHHVIGKKFWTHHGMDKEKLVLAYRMALQEREQGE